MRFSHELICQSCGMPLSTAEDFGTDSDGRKSGEYCWHCYQDGHFLDEGITLREKTEKNVAFGIEMGMSGDEARHMCETVLPHLKRWQRE